jgi:uncharacterized small protein (DUF1192 family)
MQDTLIRARVTSRLKPYRCRGPFVLTPEEQTLDVTEAQWRELCADDQLIVVRVGELPADIVALMTENESLRAQLEAFKSKAKK